MLQKHNLHKVEKLVVIGYPLGINNKICMQWGYITSLGAGQNKTVYFPISFTSINYASLAIPYTNTNTWANGATNTKKINCVNIMNITNIGGNRQYHWFCIGY